MTLGFASLIVILSGIGGYYFNTFFGDCCFYCCYYCYLICFRIMSILTSMLSSLIHSSSPSKIFKGVETLLFGWVLSLSRSIITVSDPLSRLIYLAGVASLFLEGIVAMICTSELVLLLSSSDKEMAFTIFIFFFLRNLSEVFAKLA